MCVLILIMRETAMLRAYPKSCPAACISMPPWINQMKKVPVEQGESIVKLIIAVFAATWLISGCLTNPPQQDSSGVGHKDPRTGLCHDATPPPCEPPKD